MLLIPKVDFGQVINLGTAADYALFTTAGAVKSMATYKYDAHVTGNVGSNTALPTNFGNVDGVMIGSAQAATDLAVADGQLVTATQTNVPPGISLGAPGAGQTLFAGVHVMTNATLSLNGILNLDAQNDPTKVFIFRLDGDFSVTNLSKVRLINGALACNVYWRVNGVVSLAGNTSMKGTIISHGAINLAVNDTLEGRALAIVGAITIYEGKIYTPVGCNSPTLTGPVKPDLASLACWAIFSGNGAVENTGTTTTSVGDVGNNQIGAVTGWTPGMVTGVLHNFISDPAGPIAASDLTNIYNQIYALPVDITLTEPTELGHNLVLTPHVYSMGAAGLLTDTLILNALGNTNAVFVIKIMVGGLSTYAGSAIKLINGAKSQNVFWMIASGDVDLTTNVTFRGNIVTEAGDINMRYVNIDLDGRAFTKVGAIRTEDLVAIMPPGCGSSPIVITDPMNDTVCVGDTASFAVTASGTNLTYQWMNGNNPLVNSSHISGADSATLYIYNAGVSDTSSFYYVIVSGSLMPTDSSINVSLTVNTPINITSQPPSILNVCAGDSAMFTVAATGTGITYQWRKGAADLVNGLNISGADSSTLTIHNITANDTAYNYNVVVSGTCTNDTSNNVLLALNTALIITMQPLPEQVCAGDSAIFTVAATGTGLTYQWRKGNVNLSNTGNIIGADSSSLVIFPISATDTAYNYNVVITGSCGNTTSNNVMLMVNTAPSITMQPLPEQVCAGDSAIFTVAATGTGLTYQWRKGNVNLSNTGNIIGADSSSLVIFPTSATDTAYNYNVIVSGTCAPNAASVNASLMVNSIPVATANSNSPVCAGDSISLTAQTVSGATYAWTGPNGYSSMSQDSLILVSSLSDAGAYSLIVSANGCSSLPSTVTVVVNTCIADLNIVKTASSMTPFIGTTIVFTIVANNAGPNLATQVAVNDILQSGYSYVSSSATAGTYDLSTGVWTIDTMNNNTTETLTVTVTVLGSGNYVNTAIIYGHETDLDMNNNTSSIEPVPTDFHIPEGFSPNGDGINDLFVIRGILNYPNNTFVIFNRWGNKIFEANSYKNTWNGTSTSGLRIGGDELPIGTYFYILDLKDGSDIFKGTIYLNK